MDLITNLLITLILSTVLTYFSYRMHLLTKDGAIATFAVGMVIGAFGSVNWLLILIAFALLGFAATKSGLTKKTEMGVQEGKHGERGYKNILGVGLPPCLFAILSSFVGDYHYTLMSIAFISTVAVAAADTVASEIGVKDPRVWMITTFKRCEPGMDGGVSVLGTVASLMAATVTSVIGWVLIFYTVFDPLILIPICAGMLGNILDSVIGATLETKGYVNKYENNCITGAIGALAGALVAVPLV